jgi:hypothetical protein
MSRYPHQLISMRGFVFTAAALVACLCFVPSSAAKAAVLVTIDKAAQQMTVEVDGVPRWVWPVSTGRRGEYETPAGNFRPFRMEEDHFSKEWDDAPMPHSIFFTGAGHAIHGSYETRNLGRRASHGCVRLAPGNAARLFELVKRQGLGNARVVVLMDSTAPIVAKRRAPEQNMQQTRTAAPGAPMTAPTAAMPYFTRPDQAYGRAYGYVPAQQLAAPPIVGRPPVALPMVLTPFTSN